jgi:hypothetical protein
MRWDDETSQVDLLQASQAELRQTRPRFLTPRDATGGQRPGPGETVRELR